MELGYIPNKEYRIVFNEEIFNNIIDNVKKIGNTDRNVDDNNNYYLKLLPAVDRQTNIVYENVNDNNLTPSYFYNKIFESTSINNYKTRVGNILNEFLSSKPETNNTNEYIGGGKIEWLKCVKECKKELTNLFEEEKQTTLMWLTLILNYFLHPTNLHYQLILIINSTNFQYLNGKWENDKIYFNLKYIKTDNYIEGKEEYYNKSFKLTAYGPSASGKSFLGKTLIDLLFDLDDTKYYLKKSFIANDGGIEREYSLIYRLITNFLENANSPDVDIKKRINLSDVSLSFSGIFKRKKFTDPIFKKYKSKMMEYFMNIEDIKFNVYEPTVKFNVIGSLGRKLSRKNKSRSEIRYNNTNSNNLQNLQVGGSNIYFDDELNCNIYQCLNNCFYSKNNNYRCTGTENSGIKRSVNEGKRYSSSSYEYSYSTGLNIVKKTGGLHIHNCGRQDGISIIIDYKSNNPVIGPRHLDTKYNNKFNLDKISLFEYDLIYNKSKFRYVINKQLVNKDGLYENLTLVSLSNSRQLEFVPGKTTLTNNTNQIYIEGNNGNNNNGNNGEQAAGGKYYKITKNKKKNKIHKTKKVKKVKKHNTKKKIKNNYAE